MTIASKLKQPRKPGRYILRNHLSFIDSIFIPLVLARRVTYLAKAEYSESWKSAWFFKMMGQIPVKRGGGSALAPALNAVSTG